MTDNVARLPTVSVPASDPLPVSAPAADLQIAAPVADQPRLAIEQGPSGFVYKVLDRVTGEVIRQLPHDNVVKLAEDPAYGAGKVIKTSV